MKSRKVFFLIAFFTLAFLFSSLLGEPKAQSDKSETEKWREDLRYLAEQMPKHHANLFHSITQKEFEFAVQSLYERIPSLARHRIIVEMARIVAMIGDGHTALPLVAIHPDHHLKSDFRQYPIKLYLYKDGLFIQAATSQYAGAVGARVLKIENVSAEQAFQTVKGIVSRDNEMTIKDRAPSLMVIPEILHGLGLIENMEKARFTIESKGAQTVIELTPVKSDQNIKWVDAREDTTPALWLKDVQNNYWFEYIADSRTVYMQYNAVANKHGGERMGAFFKRLFDFIESNPTDHLIIDLRLNRGGNAVLNWPLIYGIIRSEKINQKGKLFTIIGRHTFSAGMQAAIWLGQHTNTIFVGEPTGGRVQSYGDHSQIVLPNSGIEVLVAPYFYQNTYPWDERKWIAPQITAEFSSEDYRKNNDPALNAIFNYQPVAEILSAALSEGGVKLMVARYREFKSDPRHAPINTESDVNALGYYLMANGRLDVAIEVFKLNVESYPESANAYDSLGEAYLKSGNKEQAIRNYKRTLELNPKNARARQILDELQNR